jgi:hypothetical protein
MIKVTNILVLLVLFNFCFLSFGQAHKVNFEKESKIKLTENDYFSYRFTDLLNENYNSDELLVVVFFDFYNDEKSANKFIKLVSDSIAGKKKNDVPTRIIVQPIPNEYRFKDIIKSDESPLFIPPHNIYFHYKNKEYLKDFVDRMRKTLEQINIWKLSFYESPEQYSVHFFERISYGGTCILEEEAVMLKCLMPLFDPLKIEENKSKKAEKESKIKDSIINTLNTEIKNLKDELEQNKKISPPKGLNLNVFRSALGFNNARYTNAEFGFDKKKMSAKSTFYSIRIDYPFLDLTEDGVVVLEAGVGFDYGNHSIGFDGDSPINYQIESEGYHTNVSLTEINETVNFQSNSIPVFAKINYKIGDKLVISNSLGLKFQMYRNASVERNQVYGSYSRQYDGLNFEIENIASMGLENNAVLPAESYPIELKSNVLLENISYVTYQINPFFGVYGYFGFNSPFQLKVGNTTDFITSNPDEYNSIFRLAESEIRILNTSLGLGLKINF